MDLTTMLKDTTRHGDKLLIAEFENGFTAAYEKGQERWARVNEEGRAIGKTKKGKSIVRYALLSEYGMLCSGTNAQIVGTNAPTSFSPHAEEILQKYLSQRNVGKGVYESESRALQKELYQQMISSLEVENYKRHNWEEVKGSFTMGLFGWPMLLYSTIMRKPLSASGDAELALLGGPLLLGFGIKELLIPSDKAMRITNTESLSTDKKEGSPAVLLKYSDDPKNFRDLELVFPNGITLDSYGAFFPSNQDYVLEKYNGAKYFLPVDETIRDELYASIEKENRKRQKWINFQPTKEEHTALLKHVGFLEE